MSRMATTKQINYIKDLLKKVGDNPDDYDFEDLSYSEASDTITKLQFDLDYRY